MKKQTSPITKPEDYADPSRDIVHFTFGFTAGEYVENVTKARQNQSPNVGPQKGCVIVLDGYSISEQSLYELSGIYLGRSVTGERTGAISTFGYCEKSSLAKARQEFLQKAEKTVSKTVSDLRSAVKASEATLQAIKARL